MFEPRPLSQSPDYKSLSHEAVKLTHKINYHKSTLCQPGTHKHFLESPAENNNMVTIPLNMLQPSCTQPNTRQPLPQKRSAKSLLLDILKLKYYDARLTILKYYDIKSIIYLMLNDKMIRGKKIKIL